jgi:hypothetical protein
MSSSRNMTGFVPTMFTLFVLHDLLVDPLARIVQHTRHKIMVVASNFPIRGALGFRSTTTKADGMISFSPTVRVLSTHHRYAVERTNRDIKIFFWPRDGSVPVQVEFASSYEVIEPETWVRAFGNGCAVLTLFEIPDDVYTGNSCCCLVGCYV